MVQNTYEPKFLDSQCCLYFFHKQYIIISYQKIDVRPVFGPSAGADAKEIRIECVCLLARPDCCRSVDYLDCVNRFHTVVFSKIVWISQIGWNPLRTPCDPHLHFQDFQNLSKKCTGTPCEPPANPPLHFILGKILYVKIGRILFF